MKILGVETAELVAVDPGFWTSPCCGRDIERRTEGQSEWYACPGCGEPCLPGDGIPR